MIPILHNISYLQVSYRLEIVAPPVDSPASLWFVHLRGGKVIFSRIHNERIYKTKSFPVIPTQKELLEWLEPFFTLNPDVAEELVTRAVNDLHPPSVANDITVTWNNYLLQHIFPAAKVTKSAIWTFMWYVLADSHFYKYGSIPSEGLSYYQKPTYSLVARDMKTRWGMNETIISKLLGMLKHMSNNIFAPERYVQEEKKLVVRRRRGKGVE